MGLGVEWRCELNAVATAPGSVIARSSWVVGLGVEWRCELSAVATAPGSVIAQSSGVAGLDVELCRNLSAVATAPGSVIVVVTEWVGASRFPRLGPKKIREVM